MRRPARGKRAAPRTRRGSTGEAPDEAGDARAGRAAARGERLQKFLARSGLGSRRRCEELITDGRVMVDGKVVTELGTRIDPVVQEVAFDGEVLRPDKPAYFLMYKPRGYLCTHVDPEGRPTVYDLMPADQKRLFTVGRLDRDSEGLLVLTNDGNFANQLAHPRHKIEKTYVVTVKGRVTDAVVERMREGVWLAEGRTQPCRVRVLKRRPRMTKLQVTLAEGRNRQIRRMLARFDFKVPSLVRTRIGPLGTGGMRPGAVRPLRPEEVVMLGGSPGPGGKRWR